ncbi:hypothetical protein F5883DRAFT_623665 [Diaporthe sp. PMI_573]|nr:hypothetical protein F5883DRAFT_623665 [Diaporthaceae sp. PMI_573]
MGIHDAKCLQRIMPELVNSCKAIIREASIDGECNLDTPDFKDGIELNGLGDDGCEPFQFTYDDSEGECKTDRKPYDIVVCAVLLRAKYLAPDAVEVSSDGDWDDWSEAAATLSLIAGVSTVSAVYDRPFWNKCLAQLFFANPKFEPITFNFDQVGCFEQQIAEFRVPPGVPNGEAYVICGWDWGYKHEP